MQVRMDIDKECAPELVLDALELVNQPADAYHAVYCSHTLEHFYRHDVAKVLAGMHHVLRPEGSVEVYVPDLGALFARIRQGSLDITDVWYRTGNGTPITFHDVLFGWGQMLQSGNLYYAHKCGFTNVHLHAQLRAAGFTDIQLGSDGFNLRAWARK